MSNSYTHYLKGIKHLDVINLEEKMASVAADKIFPKDVFIDLSQCLFAELGALAKSLLIVESILKANAKVYVSLPTTKYTVNEEKSRHAVSAEKQKLLEALLSRRKSANSFMQMTGFVHALQKIGEIYASPVYLTESYDFEKNELNLASFEESFSVIYDDHHTNDGGYKFLLPFKWINCQNGIEEIASFETSLDRVLKNEERGLDSIDVKSIKNVVLSELIKNVFEHSETKYAIFTIGLLNSSSLARSKGSRKPNLLEQPYIDWILDNGINSQVEIYFGDSGIGILNKRYEDSIRGVSEVKDLSKKELLQSAFKKWTTSKAGESRRGTKGLYRLHRIVKKYNGLIHIDNLGYDGGFFKSQSVFRVSKYPFQGTLISIKLNPYKEIAAFRYTIDDPVEEKTKWVSDIFEINKEFSYENSIGKYIKNNLCVLILLDLTSLDLSMEDERKKLEEIFYEISKDAEPTKVVVYLINRDAKVDNDTIAILIDSVQELISQAHNGSHFPEIETADSESISDPVLVIGDNNKAFWYGGSQELIQILDESYGQGVPVDINALQSYQHLSEKVKEQLLLYLSSSSTLISIDSKYRLLFNFYGVEKHYQQTIEDAFRIEENQNVCTPKLHIVEKWVKISDVLAKDEYGFALSLYLKYRDYLQSKYDSEVKINRDNTFILIDSGQQYGLAKKFVDLLGIKPKNIRNIEYDIDFNIPKRTKLFPKGSSVILLTTVISSSETVRRLVKYAKRDFSNPEAVLCLANFRKYNISQLETWSDITKILSCFQKNETDAARVDRTPEYFSEKRDKLLSAAKIVNPTMYFDQESPDRDIISVDKELMDFLKANKLLHYNHYGVYNKRHFTFFLDKYGIVNSQSFIWDRITGSLDAWITEIGSRNYTIYLNESFSGRNGPFINFLEKKYNNKVLILNKQAGTINSSNVVFLDFGILTGDSVNDFISKCYGVNNLFVCLLFNQSINSNADIFQKIQQLKYLDVLSKEYKSTKFKIDYLFHLPLNFFTSENCPICEHRRALDFFKIDHEYLFRFSEKRQERLKQNLADELMEISYPVDFYYSKDARRQELSTEIIMQMYELKILLENARKFTKYRIELYSLIYDLNEQLDQEVKNADSKVYSLIYYLSHEINWFQQEPLIFRDLRVLISKISLMIAKLPIEQLMEFFKNTNRFEIADRDLATRYKYSAISVLRSTDKLIFCQESFDIIASFTSSQGSSNILLQNCLYHISSLFKNSYNKSELYYIEIANNLKRAQRELTLTKEQISAIDNILSENTRMRGLTVLVAEEPGAFKLMKNEWERLYKIEMPRHPLPFEEFKTLGLSQHRYLFELLSKNELSQDETNVLMEITNSLKVHWENAKNYIDNNIIHYLNDQLPALVNSSFFKSKFANLLNVGVYRAEAERLTELLEEINNSLNVYLVKEVQYETLLSYFWTNFLQVEGVSNFHDDSKILHLLADFPSNLNQEINSIFSLTKFPKRKIRLNYNNSELVSFEEENIQIYFPKSIFKMHIERILENIKAKKNPGIELVDVDIEFSITLSEAHMVNLKISYDSTEQFLKPQNVNGSLNSFKKSIEEFGGDFDYELPNESTNRFVINMKFMRYE